MASLLSTLRNRIRSRFTGKYEEKTSSSVEKGLKTRRPAAFAPYSLSIYESLLRALCATDRFRPTPFLTNPRGNGSSATVYLRHDVDFAKCWQNLDRLIELDFECGVPASIYFRVDDQEYHLADGREKVREYRSRGAEIGLHTSCYLEDDFFSKFRCETEKFADETGFRPKSFTVHGLGETRFEQRMRFQTEIPERLEEFGYEFTDCNVSMRLYSYVIEDCHWDAEAASRFIYDDFHRLPAFLQPPNNYLVLTHPSYWGPQQ